MKKVKVFKKAFLGLDQEKLAFFVQDFVPRFEAQPELAGFQPQLDAVKAAADDYEAKLLDAVPGGSDRIVLKKQARATLVDKLKILVDHVETARLPEEVLARAGFGITAERQRYQGGALAMPEIRAVKALGNGMVEVKFSHSAGNHIRSHLLEWSADLGATWYAGIAATRSPAYLSGLPPLQKVMVRMCSLGSHGRRTGWTEPFEFGVL
jgi:hypothetical protein